MPLWRSTFHPDSHRNDLDAMRTAFFEQRARVAIASIVECERANRAEGVTPVGDRLLTLLETPSDATFAVFDDPVFAIWLRYLHQAAANGQADAVREHSAKLPSVLESVAHRLSGEAPLYVPGSLIAVQHEDLDPYVKAATPPTYDFSSAEAGEQNGVGEGHPIELQAELLGIAVKTIGDVWPALHEQVLDYVRLIGYLPKGTFRTCSAARYSGVVYFGNMDESLLDIEEGLVHETGHQVLYRLAELTPLTVPGSPQEPTYKLPWSGSMRDYFGLLHAYYIYLLLVKYFWRRAQRGGPTASECRRRATLILLGCVIAKPTIESAPYLTEQGQLLVDELGGDMAQLQKLINVPDHSALGAVRG